MDKITNLFKSRRFWTAVVAVAAVSMNETLGLEEKEVIAIGAIVIAWILGDSVRST
jgi:hypothetical protein